LSGRPGWDLSPSSAQNLTIPSAVPERLLRVLLASDLTMTGAALIMPEASSRSPHISAHLNGHFNLIAAWVIPPSRRGAANAAGALAGALAGLLGDTMYVDYYYVIYEFTIAGRLCVLAARRWSVTFGTPREAKGRRDLSGGADRRRRRHARHRRRCRPRQAVEIDGSTSPNAPTFGACRHRARTRWRSSISAAPRSTIRQPRRRGMLRA
jgi:hypothetical protein